MLYQVKEEGEVSASSSQDSELTVLYELEADEALNHADFVDDSDPITDDDDYVPPNPYLTPSPPPSPRSQ